MTTIRCTIEMDMVEGEHFNSIGFDEDPISYATEEQAHKWAANYFLEYLSDLFTNGIPTVELEEYVQTKIVDDIT